MTGDWEMVTNRSLGLCEVIRKEVFQHVLIIKIFGIPDELGFKKNPTRIYLGILNLHRGGESQFYMKLRLLYEVLTGSRLTEKKKRSVLL